MSTGTRWFLVHIKRQTILTEPLLQYYTKCTTGPTNPFHGAILFDNIGLAWVAIFLVISLEGWTDVMYFVQDAHSFWNWIYFVCLIVVRYFSLITQSGPHSIEIFSRLGHSSWSTYALSSLPPSSRRQRKERRLRWKQRGRNSPRPQLSPPSPTGWFAVLKSLVIIKRNVRCDKCINKSWFCYSEENIVFE